MINIKNITTVLTDDQDIKHNNSTNRRSGFKTLQQNKQTIKIQELTNVEIDDQDTKHYNSTNRR